MDNTGIITIESVQALGQDFLHQISACADLSILESIRVHALGKKGSLTLALKSISQVDSSDRKTFGQAVNAVKCEVQDALDAQKKYLSDQALTQQLKQETIDVTLPGTFHGVGRSHPITQVMHQLSDIFGRCGFSTISGPEIEDQFHNFTALNIGENHPARAMHDTFYIDDTHLLRTHTSPAQIHVMLEQEPPIRIISLGKVYRCDSDPTHSPMFHQMEGLVVSEQASFVELKALLDYFFKTFFGRSVEMRFRPSYFPFTEPSAEVDIRMSSDAPWLEVMGCGMVHPNVFSHVNIDASRFSGYAFGLGIDRLAMLKYGIDDLRILFDNDIDFLNQF